MHKFLNGGTQISFRHVGDTEIWESRLEKEIVGPSAGQWTCHVGAWGEEGQLTDLKEVGVLGVETVVGLGLGNEVLGIVDDWGTKG